MDSRRAVNWSEQLPLDIIELVLSFLPVPNICRFRVVCKVWNTLVGKPSFHDLCDLNGQHHPEYLFMWKQSWSQSFVDPLFVRTLSFLDIGARRWYSISTAAAERLGFDTRFIAMNDGLVCTLRSLPGNDNASDLAISNPVSMSTRILPAPPTRFRTGQHHPIIFPMADGTHKMFIFIELSSAPIGAIPEQLYVHDTIRDEWRGLGNLPHEMKAAVTLHQKLYTLAHSERRNASSQNFVVISSYNPEEDTWTEVWRMNFVGKIVFKPCLVVSGNRLFVIVHFNVHNLDSIHPDPILSLFENDSDYRGVREQMYEILIPENIAKPVFQFTWAHYQRMFGDKVFCPHLFPCFDSKGACTSVVLVSTYSGIIRQFTLATRSEDVLPQHSLMPILEVPNEDNFRIDHNSMFHGAQNTKLSLRKLLAT